MKNKELSPTDVLEVFASIEDTAKKIRGLQSYTNDIKRTLHGINSAHGDKLEIKISIGNCPSFYRMPKEFLEAMFESLLKDKTVELNKETRRANNLLVKKGIIDI